MHASVAPTRALAECYRILRASARRAAEAEKNGASPLGAISQAGARLCPRKAGEQPEDRSFGNALSDDNRKRA